MNIDMDLAGINYLAVLTAVIIGYLVGAAWYTIWGRQWMAEVGLTRETVQAAGSRVRLSYLVGIAANTVMVLALAVIIQASGSTGLLDGLIVGLVAGVGFCLTTFATTYSFALRSRRLYAIDAAYPVITLAIAGALLGAWQ